MKAPVLALAALAAPLLAAGCASEAFRSEIAQEIEVDALVALEKEKWRVAAEDPAAFAAMLATDFYAVEPGAGPRDPARRMTKDQVLAALPLPNARYEIADVRVTRPTPNSAILSYRVTGALTPFEAFATSHWARRNGRWETVFYQSTTLRP